MKRRKYRKYIPPELYVVLNQNGEAFTGIKGGKFQYSSDWSEAKPLGIDHTGYCQQKRYLLIIMH